MNRDSRIDAYITGSAPFAQPILSHLRELVHRSSPEIEETFKWNHPTYLYRGKMLCGTAAFKAHATLGFWHQGMEKLLTREVGRTDDAMGLLGRLTGLADLPADRTLLRYFKAAMKLYDAGVPSRAAPKARPALPVPADLNASLRKNQAAAIFWKKLSPSHRREYLEWITEARRPATREQRLATTIKLLAAGKPRYWEYNRR